MLNTILYFVIALFVLIVIHELGHYWVARLCGVKVVRFSFGFGKVLASWRNKQGTEFSWSLIPLGGYVKMLDEDEGPVSELERHQAFNRQPVFSRMAIIIAGPLFNFLFAVFALWLVGLIGIKSLAPIIGSVTPQSIADQAGLKSDTEIISVDGQTISSWREFQYVFLPLLGSGQTVTLSYRDLANQAWHTTHLSLANLELDHEAGLLTRLGIKPFLPKLSTVVGGILPKSPAANSLIRPGDRILSIDNHKVTDWLQLVDYVKNKPNQRIVLKVEQGDQGIKIISLKTKRMVINGHASGYLGLRSQTPDWPKNWLRIQKEPPLEALNTAVLQTLHLTRATFVFIGRLVTGQLPLQSLSGPIGIAQGAGQSAQSGFAYYLSFLALVSISLGVLNILPIPMLDGGQLFYCLVELVMRRPLSMGAKMVGVYLGIVLLVSLMFIAFTNDLSRLLR